MSRLCGVLFAPRRRQPTERGAMKKLFRPRFAAVAALAIVGIVALLPGVASADNASSVPILSGPGNCGNPDGGSPIGGVTITQPKIGTLPLGVGITTPYFDLRGPRG